MRSLEFSIDLILYSRIMALGSTQPRTEMSNKNLPVGKALQARKADNLIAICEPMSTKHVSLDITQLYRHPRVATTTRARS
jgi:hypothetical protein